MASLGVLREYAKKSAPSSSLPSSVLFAHTDRTLTIFDAYPKAKFHLLIMPRLLPEMETARYKSLQTLLRWDRDKAKETLLQLKEDSKQVVEDVEDEMIRLHGYKWQIHVGFHAVPSMDHLHIHIISSDLCSPSLKNKKHYNSFHPELGFFLHLDDVLSWFGDDAHYGTLSRLPESQYDPLLKSDLACWRCHAAQKNIPTLKQHLQVEWEREKARALSHTKRKRAESGGEHDGDVHGDREEKVKRKKTVDAGDQPDTPVQ